MAQSVKIIARMKELEDLTRAFPEVSAKAREARLTEALFLLEAEVKKLTPEGAGPIHIRDTIFSQVSLRGEAFWGQVGTPSIYGEAVEHGTKPHFPPVAPILFWVEKILGLSGKEAVGVAHAIVRKIGKKGTYGTHMFQYAFERNKSKVVGILKQIPEDIVKEIMS
jgi:hypothetical protein